MTKTTQLPFITSPGENTSFIIVDNSNTARIKYSDLLRLASVNIQGLQGTQGSSTNPGAQGVQGRVGPSGAQGIRGRSGDFGVQGRDGSAVAQGIQGTTGQGVQGIQGTQGRQGIQGTNGQNAGQGVQGVQGITGSQGIQGAQGVSSISGSSDTHLLFNNSGVIAGDGSLAWNNSTKVLTLGAPSTNGTILVQGSYAFGATTIFGTEYSSGGPILAYAVAPSSSATDSFLSSYKTTTAITRGAYTIAGTTHKWFTSESQDISIGSAVKMSKKMVLNQTGLSIGPVVNADYRLHVVVNAANDGIAITTGTQKVVIYPYTSASTNNPLVREGDSTLFYTSGTMNTGALVIGPFSDITGGAGMRLDNTGNVRIGGTPFNTVKLYVNAPRVMPGYIGGTAISGESQDSIGVYGYSNNTCGIYGEGSSVSLSAGIFNRDNGAVMTYISGATYGVETNAYMYAYGTLVGSDRRLKENDKNITNALSKVMQLRPVSFDWKKDSTRGIQNKGEVLPDYGFIAQEVEPIFPELVYTSTLTKKPKDTNIKTESVLSLEEQLLNHKGIDYARFAPFFAAAIQEQQAVIDQLIERIEVLEKK